jgi:hypothetical protein
MVLATQRAVVYDIYNILSQNPAKPSFAEID